LINADYVADKLWCEGRHEDGLVSVLPHGHFERLLFAVRTNFPI
jgi:hypothetical protein